jgi:hypothetical protein
MSDLDIKSRILLAAQSGLKFTPQGMADLMTVDILAANKACLELHRGGLIELLEPPCWYGIESRRTRRSKLGLLSSQPFHGILEELTNPKSGVSG